MSKLKLISCVLFIFTLFITYSEDTMTIVYFENFPPYSWKGTNGQMNGIFIDIADEILGNQMGIHLNHIGMPWSRAQNMVKNGKADAFITVATDMRKSYTKVSDEPFLISEISIYTTNFNPNLKKIKNIKSIKDLHSYTFLDYFGNGWGNENLVNFNRIQTVNLYSAFLMLQEGRGDLIATDSLVADYTLMNLPVNNIIHLPIILDSVEMSLCIGNQSKFINILDEFDKTIKKFRNNNGIDKILDTYR